MWLTGCWRNRYEPICYPLYQCHVVYILPIIFAALSIKLTLPVTPSPVYLTYRYLHGCLTPYINALLIHLAAEPTSHLIFAILSIESPVAVQFELSKLQMLLEYFLSLPEKYELWGSRRSIYLTFSHVSARRSCKRCYDRWRSLPPWQKTWRMSRMIQRETAWSQKRGTCCAKLEIGGDQVWQSPCIQISMACTHLYMHLKCYLAWSKLSGPPCAMRDKAVCNMKALSRGRRCPCSTAVRH